METWDLTDLCADDKTALSIIKDCLKDAKDFAKQYQDLFKAAPEEHTLNKALTQYEALLEVVYKLLSYSSLKHSVNLDDDEVGKLYQAIMEMYAQIKTELVFFENGLVKLPKLPYKTKYDYFLETLRLHKAHILDDATEQYASQKSLPSRSAWVRLYDEILADIVFDFDGEKLNLEELLSKMSDLDEETRTKAAFALGEGLKSQEKIFVRIINALAQNHKIENAFRDFKHPDDAKHLDNQIEKVVVDLLTDTVKENYKNISHRYYKLKAKILGKDKIEYWDRNVPLFIGDQAKDISYEEGKEIVKKAYEAFSPRLADLVQEFYDKPWIEVYPGKGKTSGAFSHPTVPSAHPYILLNYQGKMRDVATLAHELGHGVHQMLSRKQGLLLADTPLTIAETASVFGEMLTFEELKKHNPKRMLASKIEDMLNTVVRQIAFYEFEKAAHQEIKENGELTLKELNGIFRRTQEEALGEGVNLDPVVDGFWAYISHFIHSPFYVYAYAFGDCLVNSLYMKYKQASDKKDFEEKYIEFLSAGGSKSYSDLLKPFDLDPRQKSFWENGLKVISDMIDELEALL
ncbi:MAG: M3 family oligoendopeptidase [Alphaproteobacteria bacterium]|nr:MAG: M3 family oligoendopeptidase [Alphaproteobacteria bacterium]